MANRRADGYNSLKEVKEWLKRAQNIDKEINALIQEQKKALLSATNTVNNTDSERVQTSRKNTSENKYIGYAAYSELIDKRIDELYEVKQEILSTINKVDDTVLRTLLIEKYINFQTWEQIACNMNYSYVHVVHNLHPKALNAVSKIVNSI